jgi:hypothetical protein
MTKGIPYLRPDLRPAWIQPGESCRRVNTSESFSASLLG